MPVHNNFRETVIHNLGMSVVYVVMVPFRVFTAIFRPQQGFPAMQKPAIQKMDADLKPSFVKRFFDKIKSLQIFNFLKEKKVQLFAFFNSFIQPIFKNKMRLVALAAMVYFLFRWIKTLGIFRRPSPSTITNSRQQQAALVELSQGAYPRFVTYINTKLGVDTLSDYRLGAADNSDHVSIKREIESISDPAKPSTATLKFEIDKITADIIDSQLIDTIIASMQAADPNLNTFTVNCEDYAEAQSIKTAIDRHFPGNNISIEFRSTNPGLQNQLNHLNKNAPGVPQQQPSHTNNTSNGMYFLYGAAAMGALLRTYPDLPKQAFDYLPNAIKNRFSH